MVWFVLCNDISIVSDNDDCSGGSHCIGIGQTRVDNIDGYICASLPDDKQTDTCVLSHCNGIDATSNAVLNTRKTIESNMTSILATVCTTNAPITSIQLPTTCAGNFN